MSKVLVICAKRYNGHELWTLLGILQERNHTFEVVSQETLIRDELTLQPNTIERTVYQVTPEAVGLFDAVCVVSGNMADTEAYWTDKHVISLLQAARAIDLTIAAICCSVPTLGPVVKDTKVSFFPLVRSKHHLQNYGAILQTVSVTVDQNTVTAENQMVTQMWAGEICNLLEGLPPTFKLVDSGFTPKGSQRKMSKEVRAAIDADRTSKGMPLYKPKTKPTPKNFNSDQSN